MHNKVQMLDYSPFHTVHGTASISRPKSLKAHSQAAYMFPETALLNTLLCDHYSGCATAKLSLPKLPNYNTDEENHIIPDKSEEKLYIALATFLNFSCPLAPFRLLSKGHILIKFCPELQKLKTELYFSFQTSDV